MAQLTDVQRLREWGRVATPTLAWAKPSNGLRRQNTTRTRARVRSPRPSLLLVD